MSRLRDQATYQHTKQNRWYFAQDIIKCIVLNENVWVFNNISLTRILGDLIYDKSMGLR